MLEETQFHEMTIGGLVEVIQKYNNKFETDARHCMFVDDKYIIYMHPFNNLAKKVDYEPIGNLYEQIRIFSKKYPDCVIFGNDLMSDIIGEILESNQTIDELTRMIN